MNISFNKLGLVTRVIRRALRHHKGEFALILVLGFLAGLSGGVGIGAIIPLFSVLTGQSVGVADNITNIIRDIFLFFNLPFNIAFLSVFIAFLFLLKAVIQFLARYVNGRATANYEARLRRDVFRKTLEADWPYLLNQKTGFLQTIIMNDVVMGAQILNVITNLILLGSSLAMYGFIAFKISSAITLLTMGFGLVLFFIFKPLYYRTRKVIKETGDTEKFINNYINEGIVNSKAIKISGVEKNVVAKTNIYFERLKDKRIKATVYKSAVGPFFEPIALMFIMALFVYYQRQPGFNIISFAATIYLIQKMFSFIELCQGNIQRLSEMAPYLQSVLGYRRSALQNRESSGGLADFKFNDKLELEDINFSYNSSPVLSNLNLSISRGQMVGLIGSSGAGKTTIADILLRLFRPSSGKILIDGKDIEDINIKNWRKKIGYVSQDVFLLNDTIENNIKFFDKNISNADIDKAIREANAEEFIKKLPDGAATIIGERGVRLSAGQRQRIALARVLAKNPEILILDEATSALDNESELLVQKSIDDLKGKVTVLAIAHRLSTIMNSDKLVVLEGGKISEEGSPKELLKNKDSHFYKIYNIRSEG